MKVSRSCVAFALAATLAGCSSATPGPSHWVVDVFRTTRTEVRTPASEPPALPVPPPPDLIQILKLTAPSVRGRVKLTRTQRYVRDTKAPLVGADPVAKFDTLTTVSASGSTSVTDDLGTWTFTYVPLTLKDAELKLGSIQGLRIRFRSAQRVKLEIDWDESVLIDPAGKVRQLLRQGDLGLGDGVTTSLSEIEPGGGGDDWILPTGDVILSREPGVPRPRAFFEILRPGVQLSLVLTIGRGPERIVKTFVFETRPLVVEMPGPRPISKWVGEGFAVLPRPASARDEVYEALALRNLPTQHPTRGEVEGKVLKVAAVTYDRLDPVVTLAREDTKQEYIARPVAGSIEGLAPMADLVGAHKQLMGRTLWMAEPYLETRVAVGGIGRLAVKRFTAVEVVEISGGASSAAPIRVSVRTPEGRIGFRDVHVTGTNVPEALRGRNTFEGTFLTEDPHVEFDWPSEVWTAIESGRVVAGMTAEQARMSWGTPEHVDRGVSGPQREERWRYANRPTVVLVNDVVTRIGP